MAKDFSPITRTATGAGGHSNDCKLGQMLVLPARTGSGV